MRLIKLFLFLLLFIVGCSNNSNNNNSVNNPKDYIVVPYNGPYNSFISSEIKRSDFVGEWTLLNAKYKYAEGELRNCNEIT